MAAIPKEAAVSGNDEPKKISACMTFDIARESSGKKWSKGDVQYLHKDVKMRAREDRAFQSKVSQAAKDSGISGKEYIFWKRRRLRIGEKPMVTRIYCTDLGIWRDCADRGIFPD